MSDNNEQVLFGEAPISRIACNSCGKRLSGAVVSLKGLLFHAPCYFAVPLGAEQQKVQELRERLDFEREQAEADIVTARRDAVHACLDAFHKWRVALPSDRGFNHHEGLAFEKTLKELIA